MLQIFKFGKKRNKDKLYSPKSINKWIKNLIAEFVGTFLISIALAGLCIIMPNDKQVLNYFGHQLLVGIYGIAIMGILLIVFLRWSCDINPSITIFKMINGTDSTKYGLAKIGVQFLGGVLAGLLIWALTANAIETAIDGTINNAASFKFGPFATANQHVALPKTAAFFWELFTESFITLLLLWAVFSKALSNQYRNLIIMFAFGCAIVGGMISGNSWAVNSARGLAQQIPAIFSGNIMHGGILITTIALLLSSITAPILYALLQGYVIRYGNTALLTLVAFKNSAMNTEQDKKNKIVKIIKKNVKKGSK